MTRVQFKSITHFRSKSFSLSLSLSFYLSFFKLFLVLLFSLLYPCFFLSPIYCLLILSAPCSSFLFPSLSLSLLPSLTIAFSIFSLLLSLFFPFNLPYHLFLPLNHWNVFWGNFFSPLMLIYSTINTRKIEMKKLNVSLWPFCM